jgi:hypothetical protein
MSTLLQNNQAQPFTGLGTWTFTVPSAGQYTLACNATVPAGSGLQIVLAQSGSASTSVTISVTGQTQPSIGTSYRFTCATSDVLTATLTSSNSVDSAANAIKGTLNLYSGYME